ncbi:hypothetical protein [Paenibacillus gorillae]|nr:hypothetical protein [Paenibacillus gorillae]
MIKSETVKADSADKLYKQLKRLIG